jgi:UDP-N-acetylglucosamine diphosphorylase / glucose-1-phosphate thymidylyltransferase / UDP-N-acetylgalactosamine diphosphorylase / glucosamine-1-phosphate N-acetyltransferase / galactosamine-1-phosphate N-acetyltransferase
MKVCIFEDSSVSSLAPLNHLRHTSELICGAFQLKDKLKHFLGDKYHISIHSRKYLADYYNEIYPNLEVNKLYGGDYLFLNSRVIFTKFFIDGLLLTLQDFENTALIKDKTVIAFYITGNKISSFRKRLEAKRDNNLISINDLSGLKMKLFQVDELNNDETEELNIINIPSDLILYHELEIKKDLEILLKKKAGAKKNPTNAELINRSKIYIGQGCSISRSSVLDASKGTVYIADDSVIEPFCFIQGPVYVGEGSTVRSGSKLYGPLSIGSHSKVSGEIISSVIHSYVNKQHLGFLGHSYLCEWVNLGAGTTTSNLKNNYSEIIVKLAGKDIPTGSIFLGSLIGDHTKTSINTMLNTGTFIGISSNLYGGGFHPKTVRSFSWGEASGDVVTYDIEKALNTARISMKRRNINMSKSYENLIRYHFRNIKNGKSF